MTSDIIRPDPYQRISQIAQLFKQTFSSPAYRPISEKAASSSILRLALPPDIQAELDDETVLPELRAVLSQSIEELQDAYRRIFIEACTKSLDNLPKDIPGSQMFATVLEKRFLNQALPSLMKEHTKTKEEIARSIQAASTIPSTSSKPFNSVCIPFSPIAFDLSFIPTGIHPHPYHVLSLESLPSRRRQAHTG